MKKYLNLVLLLALAVSLTSCLKDKYNALDPDKSPSVVEFKNPGFISTNSPAGSIYSVYDQSFQIDPVGVTVTYTVQLSGAKSASEDVTINIGANPTAVTAFNADMRIKNPSYNVYEALPTNAYSFPQTTYVIPKGQSTVDVRVLYKTSEFLFGKRYAFPLAITSTSFGSVSSNFGTILLNVVQKNQYDGVYAYSGTFFRNTATGPDNTLGGTLVAGLTRPLVTLGANTVSFAPLFATGAAVAGIDGTSLTIDPVTNNVTAASTTNATLKNTPGAVNKYDPASRTFTIAFEWGDAPNNRAITAVLKYSNSR
ncbi:MAG: DUF1735 domain-containing protein [Pedobacter sp.]